VLSTLQKTIKNDGPGALFRGIGPELTRGVLSAALMLMIKEQIYGVNKRIFLGGRGAAYS